MTAVALAAISAVILASPASMGIQSLSSAGYNGAIAGTALSTALSIGLLAAWSRSGREVTIEEFYEMMVWKQKAFSVEIPEMSSMPCDNPDKQFEKDLRRNFFYMINNKPVELDFDDQNEVDTRLKNYMKQSKDPYVLSRIMEGDCWNRMNDKTLEKLMSVTEGYSEVRKELGQQIFGELTTAVTLKYLNLDLGYHVATANHDQCGGNLINLVLDESGKPTTVEAYQNFRIQTTSEPPKDICYFQTKMTLNLESREAKMDFSEPQERQKTFFILSNGKSTKQYHDNTRSSEET